MVKVKERDYILADGTIDIPRWLELASTKRPEGSLKLISQACHLCQLAGGEHKTLANQSCLQQGLEMAEILLDLHADSKTIAAAILYGNVEYAELSLSDVAEQLGQPVAKLIAGAHQMESIRLYIKLNTNALDQNRTQIDNLRKMLLAMVEDVRVVLIKLAERTCLTRAAAKLPAPQQQQIATETFNIYAPLANRLGIGQLKWELEDLCFRYMHTDLYKKLAKSIDAKRLDREKYVKNVVKFLEEQLKNLGLSHFEITGRAKHIYSIYRKMIRKNVDFSQIYDAIAVRVLVDNLDDCYTVLSCAHQIWDQIEGEFDDYISNPKPNGYRSLHTAVIGPENKNLEVQIRTHNMHQESELGVAAHWKYKEGRQQQGDYENKIAWLRQVLDWQKEISETHDEDIQPTQILEDRVYVFTRDGEIIDLPKESTPLDFAYHIHSEIGNRCKGAKINGNIVPLAYKLQTGDQVEILTSKHPNPSRDWIAIMATSRAKAKVHHYFKALDQKEYIIQGQNLLDQELRHLGGPYSSTLHNFDKIARKLNLKSQADLFSLLGSGDMKVAQVLHIINEDLHINKSKEPEIPVLPDVYKEKSTSRDDIHVEGVGDLLSFFAKCCKPIPGDTIKGFITRGRGVSIHRQDCPNIINTSWPERLIDVSWAQESTHSYPVDIFLRAADRQDLLREVLSVLASEKTNLLAIKSSAKPQNNMIYVEMSVEIAGSQELAKLIKKFQQIPDMLDVTRHQQG